MLQYFKNVANSEDRNVIKKDAEKILQHRNFTIEIQRVWSANQMWYQ
jgi:hypothetical protein